MSEWIKALFVSLFGENSIIATLLISMIPIVELRGAIPFGSAVSIWGENALSLPFSFLISALGSSFICVVLAFVFMPLFSWLKKTRGFKKIAVIVEKKLKRKSKNINEKVEKEKNDKKSLYLKIAGVFAFVAIPLPLTGVWTGTCLALFIGLSRLQTILTVISGNLVAGLLMMIISYFFADNTMIVLYVFLILVAVFIIFEVIKSLIMRFRKKEGTEVNAEKVNDKV